MKEIENIVELYDRLCNESVACALATVVRIEGSSYRRIGARLLVAVDGRYTGGISGGCLEGDALRRAQQSIYAGTPSKRVYDTLEGEDREIGIGLGCNGRIEVLFVPIDYTDQANQVEVLRRQIGRRLPILLAQTVTVPVTERIPAVIEELPLDAIDLPGGRSQVLPFTRDARKYERLYELLRPAIHLVLVGNNYDILPTVITGLQLGWQISVVGSKRKFTAELAAAAHHLYDYAEATEVPVDDYTAVACMSHDFIRDRQMVEVFLPQSPAYLGLLGPRERADKLHQELLDTTSLNLLDYPRLYTPIGLDIGAETPEEIATAVVAEIISVFRRRDGLSLKYKDGTIHARF